MYLLVKYRLYLLYISLHVSLFIVFCIFIVFLLFCYLARLDTKVNKQLAE